MNKSLKIFNTGESPRSLKKITMFNWTGLAFWGNRDQFEEVKKRDELSTPGIYFLISQHEDGYFNLYVGETDNFTNRIKSHVDNKDWWESFIVFISKGESLNKAHVKYLERKFIYYSKNSPQIKLMNSTEPSEVKLSEEDEHDLTIFEGNILFTLETLGLSYFSKNKKLESKTSKTYKMRLSSKNDYTAQMNIIQDEFIVAKDSFIQLKASESFEGKSKGYFQRWKEITTDQELVEIINDDIGKLKKDLSFSSASAAASFVRARSQNGLIEWRSADGAPLKDSLE